VIIDAAYHKRWREANPDRVRDAQRRYRERHPDRLKATKERYFSTHRAAALARTAAWQAANPARWQAIRHKSEAKRKERRRQWRLEHPEIGRERVNRWMRAHPEKYALYVNRRRARLLGGGGSHTSTEWREKIELFGGCCAYCGEAKPLTRDHKIPLTRGGTDDITNIVPACVSCNSRKSTRTAREFISSR
jgi:5-methylcytosine-specific restriction endonuclease McrA